MKRRHFLSLLGGIPLGNIVWNDRAFAEEDHPKPGRNRFVLYIHMGSSCGISSGLIQPSEPGRWSKGYFKLGSDGESQNALLNLHTKADNGMVFHDYNRFLQPISGDMCLVNGDAQSLDHNVANIIQKRGTSIAAAAPEWPMAVSEFMKTASRPNPITISDGVKTVSVPDITTVQATGINDFQRITRDIEEMPKDSDAFIKILKSRFQNPKLDTVRPDKNLSALANYQLTTLTTGLKELNDAKADIKTIQDTFSKNAIKDVIKDCRDKDRIERAVTDDLRSSFELAALLVKTGLASGFHLPYGFGDHHQGACDFIAPRETSAIWAMITKFWTWVRANKLQDDVLVIVSHDFSRTPYNGKIIETDAMDKDGKNVRIRAEGRDHSLAMGMMFIHANVPKGGRIGAIADNMVPVPTKDAKGTIDKDSSPYYSADMVGSMLMRVFPELFPTERMVRKHWPAFKEINHILA